MPTRLWPHLIAYLLALGTWAAAAADPAATDPLQAWRQQHAEIRVAPDPEFAPIDSLDANGQQTGLAADYLRLVAERSGLRFRLVPVKSWKDALQALRDGRVDMLSSAFATADRAEIALFSSPYLRLPCAAFVRRGGGLARLDQIDDHRIGVAEQHGCLEALNKVAPKARVQLFPSTGKALAALNQDKVDMLVGDLVTAQAAANRSGVRDQLLVLGQIGTDEALGFAIRKDWPELKQILDRALAEIDVGEESRLRRRWLKDLLPDSPAAGGAAGDTLPHSLLPAIKGARQTLADGKNTDALQGEAIKTLLDAAQTDDERASASAGELRDLRASAATADDEAQALEQQLLQDNTASLLAWRAGLSERASVAQLEAQRSDERAALAEAQAAVAQLQARVIGQHERPAQIRDELKTAQADADKAREPAIADKQAPALLAEAARLRGQAALRLALTRIALLEEELRSYDPRLRLESARLRLRQREVGELQHKVDALQSLILDRTRAQAIALSSRLHEEAADLTEGNEVLRDVAQRNAAYGSELVQTVGHLAEVREARDTYARQSRETALALKNTAERVKYSGVSEAVGLVLLAERRKLQSVPLLKRRLAALQTELAQTRIALIELRETTQLLADPAAPVSAELKRLPPEQAAPGSAVRQSLYRLFATRAEVVPQLTLLQNRLADALADAEQELSGLARDTAALRDLLDARLLWTPSHAPLDRKLPLEVASGVADLAQPGRWWETARQTARLAWARPWPPLLGITIVVGLWLLRRRVPAALDAIAQPLRRIRTDRYRLSGRALLLTLVAAAPWPALVALISRLLVRAGESGYPFADVLAQGAAELIAPLYALEFVRWLNADKGLAAAHFRWSQGRRQALNFLRRWMLISFLPVQFFLSVYFYFGEQLASAGLARLLFIVASLLLARVSWRLLAPGALWSQRSGQNEPARLRQLLRIVLTAHSLGLAVLAAAGYFLTAMALAAHLVESAIAFLAIAVLTGMALRWLSLGERRLALKRMEDKRGDQISRDDELESRPEFAAEAEQISLASINQQTRRLLRALTVVALAGVLLWVWSDVTPALAYLGDIGAWKTSYTADGKSVTVQVTLRSLLFAAVCLMLTWIATRNIPGLLEIGVLRRLDVDAPTRYAITAVSRYALAIVGTVMGLSLLGLRWGQLQWMAAALTVGLGFGLQEIFANFVSGLIVLFERPIRVGDVITIRGVEGTVMRIRTRATTVIDWDNKEIVIPNKTFITDQLTNWTLSDNITRVVIKVGVAYDSDPDLVRALLLELARAHPKVLKEPVPSCWCVALGASTLDFELRIFVGAIMERSAVRNDLHGSVLREFRARGIEICFPQMDVWVRDADKPAALVPKDAPNP
ncbi:potassium efflux system protein [Tahibacter aquaticus]|uniref:Potassium efflux system protein n=1 Tax=Tahibacter aquaticus TaxID=520092 RepID=A0A4R6YTI2_9GAMM|nr:transporter substrate-binding domain-containing protein [Tahibacter aquaticus]TDR41713.1 potassium efflux system protein [Tahibacter aquaticus]